MKSARLIFSLLLIALITGCAGYRLGPTNGSGLGERSLQVIPFVNQTLEPRLSDAVTQQIRKQVQKDGTFRIASHDDGDVVVSGVLVTYERQELSFSPRDIATVQDYRVALTARVTAKDRSSGKVLLEQNVTGYTLVRVGKDLVSSERQALPLLAADLAKTITALLAEGSW
ncbi:MAG: LPS assembly lipoprotein LptE [Verrucomicrobiota bacterium]